MPPRLRSACDGSRVPCGAVPLSTSGEERREEAEEGVGASSRPDTAVAADGVVPSAVDCELHSARERRSVGLRSVAAERICSSQPAMILCCSSDWTGAMYERSMPLS